MGIAKSFKSLFKTRKKKDIDCPASPKNKQRNPVARNKVNIFILIFFIFNRAVSEISKE